MQIERAFIGYYFRPHFSERTHLGLRYSPDPANPSKTYYTWEEIETYHNANPNNEIVNAAILAACKDKGPGALLYTLLGLGRGLMNLDSK